MKNSDLRYRIENERLKGNGVEMQDMMKTQNKKGNLCKGSFLHLMAQSN